VSKTSDKRRGIAALAEQLERDLSGIRRALRRPLDAEVAKGDLTGPQMNVMRVVVRSDGISLKDLSQAVSLAHSTVSGIVDRLEKRGMIERQADAADGRVRRIYPTAVVKEFVRNEIPALKRRPLEEALERVSPAERATIGSAIRLLREILEQM
jgi:DNA-binding MarR family transcriptional regulator